MFAGQRSLGRSTGFVKPKRGSADAESIGSHPIFDCPPPRKARCKPTGKKFACGPYRIDVRE